MRDKGEQQADPKATEKGAKCVWSFIGILLLCCHLSRTILHLSLLIVPDFSCFSTQPTRFFFAFIVSRNRNICSRLLFTLLFTFSASLLTFRACAVFFTCTHVSLFPFLSPNRFDTRADNLDSIFNSVELVHRSRKEGKPAQNVSRVVLRPYRDREVIEASIWWKKKKLTRV